MKTIVKRILSIVLCISMLCGMVVVGDASNDRTYADTSLTGNTVNPNNKAWIGEYPTTALKTNIGEDLGTTSNPFVVLEVVPELNQAQFGYFVPGCEPIDLSVAAEDKYNVGGALGVTNNFTITTNTSGCTIKNNDAFVQKVFSNSSYGSDGFVTNVVTITPTDLGNHLDLIQDADLVYFHNATNQTTLRNCWYKYNKDDTLRGTTPAQPLDFDEGNDITNKTAIKIMRRMAEDNPPALIFDGTKAGFSSDTDIYNNIPKLEMMSTMFKASDFVSNADLELLDSIEDKSAGQTKLYYPVKKRDDSGNLIKEDGKAVDDSDKSLHWSIAKNIDDPIQAGTFAFDPSGEKDIRSYIRYSGGSFTANNVFDKIFIYDGSGFLMSDLLKTVNVNFNTQDPLHGGAYNKELVEFYKTKDPNKKEYTPLDIVKYILSIPQYKPFLSVLEIQPCQNFIYGNKDFSMKDANGHYQKTIDGKPAWVKYYEGLFPWYDSSQEEGESWVTDTTRLKVTTMTTAEFIGSTGRYEYGKQDKLGRPIQLTYESSDDLIAKFDMIVFGAWQDASNGGNGYNDPLLSNGDETLRYTAVGDLVYKFDNPNYQNKGGGSCANKLRDRVRYSGTDITLKKMLELEDFLTAGKPIVVDNALYKKQGNKYVVDTNKVDKSSKLYDLLQWKDKNSQYIFPYGTYTGKEMKNILAKSKCHIVFAEDSEAYPLEYSYSSKDTSFKWGNKTSTATGVIEYENYQAKDADGAAILKFHFYVSGVAGQKYQVRLNLDVDGDGVFRGSLKQHREIENMNRVMGYSDKEKESFDTAEVPLALTIYDNSDNELGDSSNVLLEEGKYYYAKYELPKSRLGIVPWKLEVNDAENPCIRSSAIDYTAFSKTDEADKAQLNVLQMCLPHGGLSNWNDKGITGNFIAFTCKSVDIGGSSHQYYDPDYEYSSRDHDNPGFFNSLPSDAAKKSAKKFETFLDPVNEFDVHIQFLYNKDWYTMFGDGAKNSKGETLTPDQRLAAWEEFLSEYDMIVLGFEDENCFTSNKTYAEGLDDFINQGKGMILSHDTVEGANANSKYYGDFAPWLRTVSGQRRAFYNKVEKNGKITYEKSYLTTYVNGVKIDDPSQMSEYRKYSGYDLANKVNNGTISGYIAPALYDNKKPWGHFFSSEFDFTSVEPKFYDSFVKENLDNSAQLYANYGKDHGTRHDKTDRVITSNAYSSSWPDQNAGTAIVKLANNGQITTYPYLIPSFITVANTHCQNYQLDMEYQAGGDVNVWFNLTDNHDPELKGQKNESVAYEVANKKIADGWTHIYSAKNQDSRNNFYIYNKGNITYTGSGHGTRKQELTDDEVKLFVNTMISAYRPPEDGPSVSIDNATSTTANESQIYVDYDLVRDSATDENDKGILDGNIVTDASGNRMVKVEFTLNDSGVVVSDGTTTGGSIETPESGGTTAGGTSSVPDGQTTKRTYYLSIMDAGGNKVLRSQIVSPQGVADPEEISGSDYMKGYVANKKYTMYIPYDDVAGKGQLDFTFTTYSKYKKVYKLKERAMRTPKNSTKLTVMILPLFDLN